MALFCVMFFQFYNVHAITYAIPLLSLLTILSLFG